MPADKDANENPVMLSVRVNAIGSFDHYHEILAIVRSRFGIASRSLGTYELDICEVI
jgi:hypothetical protein